MFRLGQLLGYEELIRSILKLLDELGLNLKHRPTINIGCAKSIHAKL
jgi:hypothetical protein